VTRFSLESGQRPVSGDRRRDYRQQMRLARVELVLLFTITLWALNFTMTRYVLTHGLQPLAYSVSRYTVASCLTLGIAAALGELRRPRRRDLLLFVGTGAVYYANQLGFVYALKNTSASVVALVLASTPMFAALIGLALRTGERLHRRFWLGSAVSFAGVALIALREGTQIHGNVRGVVLSVMTALAWALFSFATLRLSRSYPPIMVSAAAITMVALALWPTGFRQVTSQDWSVGWKVWVVFAAATLGPLVLTNVLWFRTLVRIGPARATLAANLQPFAAAIFAVLLLDERLGALQIVGGLLIAGGIALARRRRPLSDRGPTPGAQNPAGKG
jgi:drug/metabolite transporter (DMT)-like permease